jgi:hypothetical protein
MMKKFLFAAVATCLLSGVALAQAANPTCAQDPTDPTCVCTGGENDGDCNDGVHRGLTTGSNLLAVYTIQDHVAN